MSTSASALDQAALEPGERRALLRIVERLASELGDELVAVWLYGSAARGEEPAHEDSDIDVMVVAHGGRARHMNRVFEVIESTAPEQGADPLRFSPHVADPAWVEGRRGIESFFIQEVDRDKIVLLGGP